MWNFTDRTMSKQIVMSVLFSLALSVGGFFVSCGSNDSGPSTTSLMVQLPDGCSLDSPKDELGALGTMGAMVKVPPGQTRFVVSCGDRTIELTRDIAPYQRSITFSEDDLR